MESREQGMESRKQGKLPEQGMESGKQGPESTEHSVEPITLMQNEHVTLWYHPEDRIVHHRFEKNADSASHRAMLLKGAECLEERHAGKWLSDDRNHVVVREEDAVWGQQVWTPRVIRAGFRFWAIVLPVAAIGKLNLKRLAEEHAKLGVTVKTFTDTDAAFAWLRSV
jgi:hypothetical protein